MVGRAARGRRAGPRGAPADRRRRRRARAGRAGGRRAARAARRRAAGAGRDLRERRLRARVARAGASPTATSCAASTGASTSRPTSSRRPRGERDVEAVLEWAAGANVAVVPYGGGTSVTGGVTLRRAGALRRRRVARPRRDGPRAADRRRLARGADPGRRDRAGAREAAARAGPDAALLPAVLRAVDARRLDRHARGRALRHGRDAHRRPRRVRARDHAERRLAVAAAARLGRGRRRRTGCCSARRGSSGVITEAWVRVRPRPQAHSLAAVRFASFADGMEALRAIAQSGLRPSNCRLIDAEEARMTGAVGRHAALLVLGFEGASEAVVPGRRAARPRRCTSAPRPAASGTTAPCAGRASPATPRASGDAVGAWRAAFFRAPYLRDAFVAMGILSETFETAVTWERFAALHEAVTAAAARGDRAGRPDHVPHLARLSRRAGAVLHRAGARAARRGGRAVGADQGAPSATRCSPPAARSPTTTPSGATTGPGTTASARTRSPRRWRREGRRRPGRAAEPGRLDRRLIRATV